MTAADAPQPPNTGKRVLVVVDDPAAAETLAPALREAGFDVQVETTFTPALEALEGDRTIDLLIADMVMPHGVNGIALSRMARMRQRNIKVIYIAPDDVPGVEEEALGPILRKPAAAERLVAEAHRLLAGDP